MVIKIIMEINSEKSYYLHVRYPWGELRTVEVSKVSRDEDGTIRWSGVSVGLEPCLDGIISETSSWLTGWLGGTCDTLAALCEDSEAPPGF